MPYEFYKVLHYTGLIITFTSLSGYIFYTMQDKTNTKKKFFSILHGIGLLILLVSGFGLAARLGFMSQLPTWVYIKLVLWLAVGAALTMVKRQVMGPMALYLFIVVLGILASVTAVTKFIS
ncbi:MAG: SirB2 family protein [Bdellovibrionaceae bacterium]|jgi:uncharacterized membrane protein SirB2|nr:SirB2 family protein [Pseudobdellovibrionaceae bacterium]